MEYNYVVFGHEWDLYKLSYSDLLKLSNARYIGGLWDDDNKIRSILKHVLFSRKIPQCVYLPFLGIWNTTFFKNPFNDNKPICFVFFNIWLEPISFGLLTYLRKNYPRSKFVLFSQDLVEKIYIGHQKHPIDIIETKKLFDLWISFDRQDCKKYGLLYHPLVFSSFHGKLEDYPNKDIYFLGAAKNRLAEIIKTFEKCWENNLNTDFYLIGVESKDQVYKNKIHYIKSMSYAENLQHVLHCNCELEIMQAGGYGYTQRMCEVISLDKKLITNNPIVHEAPFYNPNYIFQIKSAKDITPEICEKIKKHEPVDYHYKENLSPVELLQFIEKHLS